MKYKNIPSALHNFADSFTSDSNCVASDTTMAYLARRAINGRGELLTFDILAGTATPPHLVEPPVDEAIRAYAGHFPEHLKRQNVEPAKIEKAILELSFVVERRSDALGFPGSSEMPVDCAIQARDDRGRSHEVRFRRWCLFYNSDPESDRRTHNSMR